MNFLYNKQAAAFIAAVAISGSTYAQHTKVKTITIVNGDTTISESNVDEKTLSQMEKEMSIRIDDGGKSEKKIVKKIIISGDADDKQTTEARAYAYSYGDDAGQDIQVITDGEDGDTKIIIKKGNKEKSDAKEKKVIVKKSGGENSTKSESSSLSISINVKNTTAKLEVESNSKEPLNISILDENGRQVFYDTQKEGGKYSREIPLGKKGTYFLNLIQNKKSSTEKIIVE